MTQSVKIIVGILTLLPMVCLCIYLYNFFMLFAQIMTEAGTSHPANPDMGAFFNMFGSMMAVMLIMIILSFALLIYYIIHCVNNTAIDSNERIVWILVFVFAGMVGFPIYWYMRIWKDHAKN